MLWSNTRYRLDIYSECHIIVHTHIHSVTSSFSSTREHTVPIIWTDKCYINLRSVHILRSVPHLKLSNQATSQYNTAHALAIPFLVVLGFFFSPTDTINRLWDSNSSWMRTAHISHHKLSDMLLPGMYGRVCVQIRQYWSEHLCAPTSSTSYVLIFINVFRFWRFFLSSSLCLSLSCFFHFPRFLFAIATLYSVLVYTMPSETNNECAALLYFFFFFFYFHSIACRLAIAQPYHRNIQCGPLYLALLL